MLNHVWHSNSATSNLVMTHIAPQSALRTQRNSDKGFLCVLCVLCGV